MKWKNHLQIANLVADELSLPRELREVLRQGVIQPDKEGDKVVRFDRQGLPYRQRVRHHKVRWRFIMSLVWKARLAHLEGREEDAVWCLGRAMHYVQDRSVAIGPFGILHDRREAEIGRRKASPESVEVGAIAAAPSPIFVEMCLRTLAPRRSPHAALHQACALSSAMANAVLSDPTPGPMFQHDLLRLQRRHRRLFFPAALLAGAIPLALAPLLGDPYIAVLSLPLAVGVLMSDLAYRDGKKSARWFALD